MRQAGEISVNHTVSFACPLEGILASQIPGCVPVIREPFLPGQVCMIGGLKLADGMPSKGREAERKQHGISLLLLSHQKRTPKVNTK